MSHYRAWRVESEWVDVNKKQTDGLVLCAVRVLIKPNVADAAPLPWPAARPAPALARAPARRPALQIGVDIEQHGIDTGDQQQDGSLDVAP